MTEEKIIYPEAAECSDKKDVERYLARQSVEWDGRAMLYSEVADCYFDSIEEAEEYAFETQLSLADLRIRICENEAVRGGLLPWKPGKCRLKVDEN